MKTIIAALLLLATTASAQVVLQPGQTALCAPSVPTATATATPVPPTPTPQPTATPVPVQLFSSITVPNIIPWPVGVLGAIYGAILQPATIRSINIFVDGVKLPSYQLGFPSTGPSWVYPVGATSLGFSSYWTPTTPGLHIITFIAYGDLAATQPLNVPSAASVPPTLYQRTIQ